MTEGVSKLRAENPQLSALETSLELNSYACAVQKNSSYAEVISRPFVLEYNNEYFKMFVKTQFSIYKAIEFGVMEKWMKVWFARDKIKKNELGSKFHSNVKHVSISDVIGIYILIAVGLSGAFFSLIIEK